MTVSREQIRGWYQVATRRVNKKNISTEYYFELAVELVEIVYSQIKAHPVALLEATIEVQAAELERLKGVEAQLREALHYIATSPKLQGSLWADFAKMSLDAIADNSTRPPQRDD